MCYAYDRILKDIGAKKSQGKKFIDVQILLRNSTCHLFCIKMVESYLTGHVRNIDGLQALNQV